jgi:Holliday junction DNA helicase RuvB
MEKIIGHELTKKQIRIAIKAAHSRNEAIPHLLFSGLAGTGKTTLSMEIARTAAVDFLPISPDDVLDMDSALSIMDKLDHTNYDRFGNRTSYIKPTILFFDEIHRMPRKGQEILGIAMEKFQLETGKPNKFFWIPYFTVIGATTDDGELTKPFREKFKLRFIFDAYSYEEMINIVFFHANMKQINITGKAVREIALRSRGIPRIAVNYLERVRDYSYSLGAEIVTFKNVEEAFFELGIDSKGLTPTEIRVLKILYANREPIGLDNLAIITNESQKNIKNTVEPFLIQQGLMVRSGRGRVITDQGRRHLEQFGYAGRTIDKAEIGAGYVRQ